MRQPTLSRLEDAPSWRLPGRMGPSMIYLFCASFRDELERIVLDIDDTDDPVHGGPQLALFNAHYDEYIFQLIHIFEATTGEAVLPLLRPAARCGARRRSKPYAAPSSRSPGASRSSNPASGSPCRQPIHIGRLSCLWPVGYKPKAPEPSGRCRRINPEHQPPKSLKIRL